MRLKYRLSFPRAGAVALTTSEPTTMATQVSHWHPARGRNEADSIQWQGDGLDSPLPIHTAGADASANIRATSLSTHGPPSPNTTVPFGLVCSEARPKLSQETWNPSYGIVFAASYATLSMSQKIANAKAAKAAKARQERQSMVKTAAISRGNTPTHIERNAIEKSQVVVRTTKQAMASKVSRPATSTPLSNQKVVMADRQSSQKPQTNEEPSGDAFAGLFNTVNSVAQGILEQFEAISEPAAPSKGSDTLTTAKKGGIYDLRIRETKPSARDSEVVQATSNKPLDWRQKALRAMYRADREARNSTKEPDTKTANLAQRKISKDDPETQKALQDSLQRRAAKQKRRLEARRNAELREMRKIQDKINHEKAMRAEREASRQPRPSPQQADIMREIQKVQEYRGQYEQEARAKARDSYSSYRVLFDEYFASASAVSKSVAAVRHYHFYRQKDILKLDGRPLLSKLRLEGRPGISSEQMMEYHIDMEEYWKSCAAAMSHRNKMLKNYTHESRKLTRFYRYRAEFMSPARRQAYAIFHALDSRMVTTWDNLNEIASDIRDLVAIRCTDARKYQLVLKWTSAPLRGMAEMTDSRDLKQVIQKFILLLRSNSAVATSFPAFLQKLPTSLFLENICYPELASESLLRPFKVFAFEFGKSLVDLEDLIRETKANPEHERFGRYYKVLFALDSMGPNHLPYHEISEFESMLWIREQEPVVIKEMEAYAPVLRKNARAFLRSSRRARRSNVLLQYGEQKRSSGKIVITRAAAKAARQAKASSAALPLSRRIEELKYAQCYICGEYGHYKADCPRTRTASSTQAPTPASTRQAQAQVMDAWLASSTKDTTAGSSQVLSERSSLAAKVPKPLQLDAAVTRPDLPSQQAPPATDPSGPSESESNRPSTWQSLLPNSGAYAAKMPRILQRPEQNPTIVLPGSSGGWGTLSTRQELELEKRKQSAAEAEREKWGQMEAPEELEKEKMMKSQRKEAAGPALAERRRTESNPGSIERQRTLQMNQLSEDVHINRILVDAVRRVREREEQLEQDSAKIQEQDPVAYYAQHFKKDPKSKSKSLPPLRSSKEGSAATEASARGPKMTKEESSHFHEKQRIARTSESASVATEVPTGSLVNRTLGPGSEFSRTASAPRWEADRVQEKLGEGQLLAGNTIQLLKSPAAASLSADVSPQSVSIDTYFKELKTKKGRDKKKEMKAVKDHDKEKETNDTKSEDHQKLKAERDRRKKEADDMESEVKRLREGIALERQIQEDRERFEQFREEAKELSELRKTLGSVRSKHGAARSPGSTALNNDSKKITGSSSNSMDSHSYDSPANTTRESSDMGRQDALSQNYTTPKIRYHPFNHIHNAQSPSNARSYHAWATVNIDHVTASLNLSPTRSIRAPHPGNDPNAPIALEHKKDPANLLDEPDSFEGPPSSADVLSPEDADIPTVSRLVNVKVAGKRTPPTSAAQELGSEGSWDTIKQGSAFMNYDDREAETASPLRSVEQHPSDSPKVFASMAHDDLDSHRVLGSTSSESTAQDPLGGSVNWGVLNQNKPTGYQEQEFSSSGSAEQEISVIPAPWGSMNQTQPSSQEVPVAGPPEETQESQDPPWPSAQDNDHDRNEGEVSQGRENDGSDREVNQDRDNDGNDSDAKSLSSGSQSDDEGDVSGNEPPSDDEGSSDDSGSDSDGEDVEKHVPLTYQIPRETLRTAMKTSKSNVDGSSWSYTLYRGPNNEEIALHYCRNMEVAETVAKYFLDEQVLGFDIEWKPNASAAAGIKGNASLIQLASENRIALFHISLFKGTTAEELLPPTIKTILETPAILKTGVAVKSDFTRLKKFLGVEARGVFELSHLYKLVKFSKDEPEKVNRTLVSLANQVAEHLQLPLHKGAVRESDWSKPLLIEQMRYAASDAYAGVRLFDVLEAKRKKLRPTPPRPQCAELGLPIALAGGVKVRRVKSKMPVVVVEEEEESDEYESALEEQEVVEESEEETSSLDLSGDELSDELSEEEFIAPPTERVGRVRLQGLSTVPVEPALLPEQTQPEEEEESMDDDLESLSESSDEDISAVTKQIGRVNLSTTSPSTSATQHPPTSSPTSALELAAFWIDAWHNSLPMEYQPKATSGQLRAYALWHEQNLSVAEIAALLRDPPLAISTVSSYVLTAVMLEGLPYKEERIKVLLLAMPSRVVTARYRGILRGLGVEEVGELSGA